jgi:hypothetical protein
MRKAGEVKDVEPETSVVTGGADPGRYELPMLTSARVTDPG